MDLMVHPLEAAVIITSFKEWRVQVGESVRTSIFSESSSEPLATSRALIIFFPSSYFSVNYITLHLFNSVQQQKYI